MSVVPLGDTPTRAVVPVDVGLADAGHVVPFVEGLRTYERTPEGRRYLRGYLDAAAYVDRPHPRAV